MYKNSPTYEYKPEEYYASSYEDLELESKLIDTIDSMDEKEFLKKYEDRILELKNPALSYVIMKKVEGAKKEQHRKVILESDNGAYNYRLLFDYCPLHPIKFRQHIAALENSKDSKYIYYLYKHSSTPNHFAKLIVDRGEPRSNFLLFQDKYFGSAIKKNIEFDIDKNRQNIINSNNPDYNLYYASYLSWANTNEMLKEALGYKDLNEKELFELIKPHADVLIKNHNNDMIYCLRFINYLFWYKFNYSNNTDIINYINTFANIILENEETKYKVECAAFLEKNNYTFFDLSKFEDSVIKSGNIEDCIQYASTFDTSRIRDFARIVINSSDDYQIETFFKYGKNAYQLLLEREFYPYSYLYTNVDNKEEISFRLKELNNKEHDIDNDRKMEYKRILEEKLADITLNEALPVEKININSPEEEFDILLNTMTGDKSKSTIK